MSMLVEYRERMTKALVELKELQGKDERSADDESRVDTLLAEVNDLGPKIEREAAVEAATRQASQYTESRSGRQVPTEGQDGESRQEPAGESREANGGSFGRRFAHSDQLKDYANRPVNSSQRYDAGSFFHRGNPEDMEQRALVYTGATTDLVALQRVPGIFRGDLMPFTVSMRDVIPNYTTDSNSVEYVRELAYTNAAAETAEAVSVATGAKPESTLTFEVVNTPVVTIAHWVPVTRQVLQDAGQLESYINNRLLEGLRLREDAAIIAGSGTPPAMRGLMATTGIGNLDAAYWTANPLPTVASAANNLDRLRRAITYIAINGQAQPNFVVLHPTDAANFDMLKTTTGEYVLAGPLNYSPIRRLWSQLVVVENTNMTAGQFLVGYGPAAGIFDRMDAQIFVADQHSDFFIRNIFVVLAEERLALAVFRPAAFAKGVFA
jgi:HK97 family phage major capsid protein